MLNLSKKLVGAGWTAKIDRYNNGISFQAWFSGDKGLLIDTMQESGKGYSLIELMIVVVIVGILGTYASFNFSSGGARLNQATNSYTMFMDDGPAGNNWVYDNPGDTMLSANVTITSPVQISEAVMMNSDNTKG